MVRIHVYDVYLDLGVMAVVSDVHLDGNPRDLRCIGGWIDRLGVSYVAFAGDIFDRLNRMVLDEEVLAYALTRLGLDGGGVRVIFYTLAHHDHDPTIPGDFAVFHVNGIDVIAVKGAVRVRTPRGVVSIIHGDFALGNGLLLGMLNHATRLPLAELFTRMALGLGDDEWLIMGHTHMPLINRRLRVANTGSWVNRPRSTDTMVIVGPGQHGLSVELVRVSCS